MVRWWDEDVARSQLRNILLFAIAYFSFALRFRIFPLRLIRFIAHTMIIVWFIGPYIRVVVCAPVRQLIDYVWSLISVHLSFSICCASNLFHPERNHLFIRMGKCIWPRRTSSRSWTVHDDDYRDYVVAYVVVLALSAGRYRHICRQSETQTTIWRLRDKEVRKKWKTIYSH